MLSLRPFIRLSIRHLDGCLSVHPSVFTYVRLSVHTSVCLLVCPPVTLRYGSSHYRIDLKLAHKVDIYLTLSWRGYFKHLSMSNSHILNLDDITHSQTTASVLKVVSIYRMDLRA